MSLREEPIRLQAKADHGRLRLVGSWGEKPIDDLRVTRGATGALDTFIRQTVARARQQGCTWSEIGAALGMSKQSAWERFAGEGRRDSWIDPGRSVTLTGPHDRTIDPHSAHSKAHHRDSARSRGGVTHLAIAGPVRVRICPLAPAPARHTRPL